METESKRLSPDFTMTRSTQAQLIKVTKVPRHNYLFGAYADGRVGVFNLKKQQYQETINLYKDCEVIDLEIMDDNLAACTHSEVTVHNIQKSKSISLKGHQSTPFFVSCHPISPLVLSCSKLLILHDLRIGKPINVNFITPPAYSLEYFSDGQFFLLGGEPTRIGNSQWARTLLNGLARSSHNGRYVFMNEMNGKLSLWDWRESEQVLQIQGVQNHEVYQPPFFGMVDGRTRNLLFLDERSNVLVFDIVKERKSGLQLQQMDNSKLFLDKLQRHTSQFFRYTHTGTIQSYSLELQ